MTRKKPVKKEKKVQKASMGFFSKSNKKNSIWFKIGGRFVKEEKYLSHTGVSKTTLELAKQTIVKPLETRNGFLRNKDKDLAKEFLNDFLNNKEAHRSKYSITLYATKTSSFNILKGKRIFINGTELTFNELNYFFAKLLDSLGGVWYATFDALINEKENSASITVNPRKITEK